MSNIKSTFGLSLIFYFSLLTWSPQAIIAQTPTQNPSVGINEELFVPLEGIDHWVLIRGKDISNPVILFLHGGPGSPLSPYSEAIFEGWDEKFTLVQWDQRGAGRTFGTYAPAELDPDFLVTHPLSLDKMLRDGIALTEYLKERLQQDKIILFGTSWGSVLGARMAAAYPEHFYAYLGHSQVVTPEEDLIDAYERLTDTVNLAKDDEAIQLLKSLGAPPYDKARDAGQFFRVLKKYERLNAAPAPEAWWEVSPAFNNPSDVKHRADGDDYSFLSYVGDKEMGVPSIASTIDLREQANHFLVPVYFIQGEYDILTPVETTRGYFKQLQAPQKELFLVPTAAHGFNSAVIDQIYQVLMERVLPLIEKK